MLKGQAKTNYQREYMKKRRLDPAIQASERRAGKERHRGNGHNTGTCEICSYSETTDTHHEGAARVEHTLCPNHHALITRGLATLLDLTQPTVRPGVKTPGKTNLKAKLAKAGLNIGKDGTLDLTQSTREPVRPESNTTVPMFNPSIHKAGDKVMVYQGKRLIETVIPDLDGDGQPVYDV